MLLAVPSPWTKNLRYRLWPTRRLFEHRIDQLAGQLASLRASIDELAVRQERALAGQAELQTRLRRTQALSARVYEALQDWPALVAAAREQPTYDLAYEAPNPLVSIPIPTFHSPDTLCHRALASVRAQTHGNWEAIVVGDHCTDDTEERVLALGDPRIRFHNLPVRENDPHDPWERWAVKGSVPRATGIELSAGSWIAPLSHDDAWDPDHLTTLLTAARERRSEVVYSRMRATVAQDSGSTSPSIGAWPPAIGQFCWQSAVFHGALRFLRYDRTCALASEPNDWNLARRAWEAGVRFHFVDRETSTLYLHRRAEQMAAQYAAMGLPMAAAAYP
jgi:Glycosyl transferase family 2